MFQRLAGALGAVLLLAAAPPAGAFLYVRGSDQSSGDLVAVWFNSSFELIVNLGPIDALQIGTVATFVPPSQFGGTLSGTKFTALAVPNPDATFSGVPMSPPAYNIGFTSNGDPGLVNFNQVGAAQAVLDTPTAGQAWLLSLNNIPAVGSDPNVIENSDGDALIAVALSESYSGNIGLGTDTIANNIPISTSVPIDPGDTGKEYSIALYEVFQTLTPSNGKYILGTQVDRLGYLNGDNGEGGMAHLSLAAPEPGRGGLAAAVAGALAWIGRRRRAGPRSQS